MPSNHLILCHHFSCLQYFPSIKLLLLLFLLFSPNGLTLPIRWPKYWSFSISSSTEYSGLISLRIDWLDLLAVQGLSRAFSNMTVQKYQFFGTQISLWSIYIPYMTSGKTIVLTRQTFVGKVMSLLFNMLSRFVIVLLPRSKHLLISWLQSPSTVILEPPKIKSHSFPIYLPWSDGTRCHDLCFLNVEF